MTNRDTSLVAMHPDSDARPAIEIVTDAALVAGLALLAARKTEAKTEPIKERRP